MRTCCANENEEGPLRCDLADPGCGAVSILSMAIVCPRVVLAQDFHFRVLFILLLCHKGIGEIVTTRRALRLDVCERLGVVPSLTMLSTTKPFCLVVVNLPKESCLIAIAVHGGEDGIVVKEVGRVEATATCGPIRTEIMIESTGQPCAAAWCAYRT